MLKVRLRRGAGEAAGRGGVLVLPLPEGAPLPAPFRAAAAASGFAGRAGQVLDLPDAEGGRVLLVGAGPAGPLRPAAWERVGGTAAAALPEAATRLVLDARALPPEAAAALAAGACLRAWRFEELLSRPPARRLRHLDLLVAEEAAASAAWEAVAPGLRGCLLARDLAAEPANRLTPRAFAARLEGLAEHGIAVDVLGRRRLERLGLGALLAVGGGSAEGPRLAVLRWRGAFAAPPVAFIGKGICFDTGGISIKRGPGMEAMKGDMAGAAACAGAMLALALRRSPCPAVAVLPIAENATGAASYRPGDVLRMLSGRTVEVVDTDAEGRLVLADALHYAEARFRPRAMVDIATLTGAAVTALGHHRAALYGTDAALMAQLAAAGEAVGEPLWPLPVGAAMREDLRSAIADLRQCAPAGGGPLPDAGHAAAFLSAFVGEGAAWAHLDIAGTDMAEEDGPLAAGGWPTGFGARLLDRLVALHFETPPEDPPGDGRRRPR